MRKVKRRYKILLLITGILIIGVYLDAEEITNKVIDAQSLQVDTISGATYSSKAILKAVENALKSEKGNENE